MLSTTSAPSLSILRFAVDGNISSERRSGKPLVQLCSDGATYRRPSRDHQRRDSRPVTLPHSPPRRSRSVTAATAQGSTGLLRSHGVAAASSQLSIWHGGKLCGMIDFCRVLTRVCHECRVPVPVSMLEADASGVPVVTSDRSFE